MEHNFESLFERVSEFQDKVFKDQTALSKSIHLQREAKELTESLNGYDFNETKMELADCLILLLGTAKKLGLSANELIEDSFIKLIICEHREWDKADEQGVYHHK